MVLSEDKYRVLMQFKEKNCLIFKTDYKPQNNQKYVNSIKKDTSFKRTSTYFRWT